MLRRSSGGQVLQVEGQGSDRLVEPQQRALAFIDAPFETLEPVSHFEKCSQQLGDGGLGVRQESAVKIDATIVMPPANRRFAEAAPSG
jgi:hypothetical protein